MRLWESKFSNLLEEYMIEFFESDYVAYTKMNLDTKAHPDLLFFKPE